MVSAPRTTTASLVLVGSLLLSDAAATASRKGRRRGGAAQNDNRQLRTRKLSKGSKQYEPQSDGLLGRNDNGVGGVQPPVVAGCFRDFKMCEATGTLVSRNPALGCEFDPCPPGENSDNVDTASENNDAEGNVPGESNNGYEEGDFLLPNGAWVGCNWVAKKKTTERCQDKTADNELVSNLCPEVCNTATIVDILAVSTATHNLVDSLETTSAAGNCTLPSGMIVDCDWVEKRVESRCFKKTDDGRQVRYLCPVCTHVVEIVNPISSADNTTHDGL